MNEEFIRIFDTYKNDIYRLIYSYTLNINDSKDILQDTFLKYYNNISSLPQDNDIFIKKWLMRVAINISKDYNKCFWKRNILNYEDNIKIKNLYKSKDNIEVLDILNKLDKKYRIPIYLYYYEGYSVLEIASILKISESAVKMRLKRAKEMLKIEMEKI